MSRRKRNWQAKKAFDARALARVLTMPEEAFAGRYGMETVRVPKSKWRDAGDFYAFRDNGSDILAVAHLDTVVDHSQRKAEFYVTDNGLAVVSGALDDRLGAYAILELLPKLGVTHDVLLTTGEESGQSTASYFDTAKDYKWVIEFDRMGTDVVMYQYDDEGAREAVRAAGAVPGKGSFSDIAYLDDLGVKCFNWGIGYRGNYHSVDGYAYLNDTFAMVEKYRKFRALHGDTAMPHVPEPVKGYSGGYRGLLADEFDDKQCWWCSQYTVDLVTGYCTNPACTACQDCGEFEVSCMCWLPAEARTRETREHLLAIAAAEDANASALSEYDRGDGETADDLEREPECRHLNYTTCGCNNGLQEPTANVA